MDEKKRLTLEAAGFTVGNSGDFLGLSEAERLDIQLDAILRKMNETFRFLEQYFGPLPAGR